MATCFAILLTITIHVRTCLAPKKVARFFPKVVRRSTSIINSFCSKVSKQVALFCCPFYHTLSVIRQRKLSTLFMMMIIIIIIIIIITIMIIITEPGHKENWHLNLGEYHLNLDFILIYNICKLSDLIRRRNYWRVKVNQESNFIV